MKYIFLFAIGVSAVIAALSGCGGSPVNAGAPEYFGPPVVPANKTNKTMRAFRSEQDLKAYLREIAERQKRDRARRGAGGDGTTYSTGSAAPAPAAKAEADKLSYDGQESVTNVQHAGVDEGGIVKLHGDHLVVLRRGRLFTIAIGDQSLKPISTVNAFGPEIDPQGTWYDEMLISENTIAVIGYSYARGGTEVGLFRIDSDGNLSYRSTYHLRSNDYYSSRNYASRLIGDKLIFYTPLYLDPGADDPLQNFPAVRKWHKGATPEEFRRIVSATRVYRPERQLNTAYGMALHTVTICDLSNGGFTCEATGVVGPAGRVFYVSPEAVYVWVTDWYTRGDRTRTQSMVYRMPLDGSSPQALAVSGSPVDQFSFLESKDGNLNVLVRSDGSGDSMWNAERTRGAVALMRVPLSEFSDGSQSVPSWRYRELPTPSGYTFQNRFVGDYLLYGSGSGWDYPRQTNRSSLYAVRWAGGDPHELSLVHGVDRIEALGSDAVVVGTDGNDLHFTSIRLGEAPEVEDRYTRKAASQGELRSHGFFYKPDGPDSGLLGLPISLPGRPGYRHLVEGSASVLFLRNSDLHFHEIGELEARTETAADDGCRASCVDWYGNARPLFVRGRIFALLGYEIAEGTLKNGGIREVRRMSFAPSKVRREMVGVASQE